MPIFALTHDQYIKHLYLQGLPLDITKATFARLAGYADASAVTDAEHDAALVRAALAAGEHPLDLVG